MTETDDTVYLSATQIGRLTSCEMKWVLGKTSEAPAQEKSVPLQLGTLLHRLVGAWYLGKDWHSEYMLARSEWQLDQLDQAYDEWEPVLPEYFSRAEDILEDWVRFYGPEPEVPALAVELPFNLQVPGVPGVRVRGFMDGVLGLPVDDNRTHDRIRVLELKSMGRWGREKLVPDDPQLWLYLWALDHLVPVEGVRFDAISTYAYKEPSPEKRFKRIDLEWSQAKVDDSVVNLQKVARRALELLEDPESAIKNISDASCTWCDFRTQCLGARTEQ